MDEGPNRRDFIKTAGTAGALLGVSLAAQARRADPLGPGFDMQKPLIDNWHEQLGAVVHIDLDMDASELQDPAVRERHRIYCYLLMKLIHRFFNGNKNGPFGIYPQRDRRQLAGPIPSRTEPRLYRGDMNPNPDKDRINWDRYLGHNIACLAVDGDGHIIDFDFNHNALFRSSAEHAESRLVRRLLSLTDVFDSWKTGPRINNKPHAASLGQVTLYTTLESCAQCAGVMSLAGVKQIIYMQNDFTTYKIGNLMYNLANRIEIKDGAGPWSRPFPAHQFRFRHPKSSSRSSKYSTTQILISPIGYRLGTSSSSNLPTARLIATLRSPLFFAPIRPTKFLRREARSWIAFRCGLSNSLLKTRFRLTRARFSPTRSASRKRVNSLNTLISKGIAVHLTSSNAGARTAGLEAAAREGSIGRTCLDKV